ncbi:hypothetical protein JCM10908_005973 [Rhodotorula pacifica]|uniref:uncharacterized protein n=1 Tax=Rhodotorula pacifica TaxID=1495444 RepID=UPI003171A525
MAADLSDQNRAKADQLVHHFYAKTVAVISQARGAEAAASIGTPSVGGTNAAAGPPESDRRTVSGATKTRRSNKWFNLELPDPEAFRSQLKTWRTVSSSLPSASSPSSSSSATHPEPASSGGPPPLVLQVVLDSSDLTSNQTVVLSDQRGRRVRVEPPASHHQQQQNQYGHAIARPASAAGYGRRAISPYPPPTSATGAGAVHGAYRPGTSSAGTRSPARGSVSANAMPPIVLEQWTLDLVPVAAPSTAESRSRRKGETGEVSPPHPGSSDPSPLSSGTASTSYSYPSATAPAPTSAPAVPPPTAIELATVYKHSILHFRTLYSLVRTLPAYTLARTLARRRKGLATTLGGGGARRGEGGAGESRDREHSTTRTGGIPRNGAGLSVGVRLQAGSKAHSSSADQPPVSAATPIDDVHQDEEVIAVNVPLDGAEDSSVAAWTARGGPGGAETGGRTRKTTEQIVFPGVVTPFGALVLSLEYRTNTDFAVEDIETLLSSRFIDEDFFRPTVARYTSTAGPRDPPVPDEVVRPGSLPISAAFQPRAATERTTSGSPSGLRRETGSAVPSPPDQQAYAYPAARRPSEPANEPPQTAPPSRRELIVRAATAPLPVPGSLPRPSSLASGSATSSRYGGEGGGRAGEEVTGTTGPSSATAVAGTPSTGLGAGGHVEPAFISLSRARGASFGGSGSGIGSGIQRSSPLSGSPGDSGTSALPPAGGTAPVVGSLPRRASLTSSGASGSPIFRPGSYVGAAPGLSSSPSQGFGYGYGHAFSYSGSAAGIIRQQPASGSPSSQHSFNMSRSPLAGPPTFPGGASGPAPAPRPIAQSVRTSSFTGGGAYGSQGSYTASRSYGRTGSSAGSAEWPAGAPGGGGGPESLSRRSTASRLSFGAAGSPAIAAVAAGRSSRLGTMMRQHDEGRFPLTASTSAPTTSAAKRFLNDGKPPEDAAEIEDFLSMLDSKPDLRALDSSRSLPATSGARSVVMSKRDVDEQLRMLKSSVFGNVSGTSGESPSPPTFTSSLAVMPGAAGISASPRASSGLSALRRQTSRLSIEEHPAEELAAEAAAAAAAAAATTQPVQFSPVRERLSPPSLSAADNGGNGSNGGNGLDRTPRGGYRTLKRDILVSPTLSATSSSTALPPPLSGESPLHLEPRFLPLPMSSTTSPLASPRHQPHAPPFPCIVPSAAQPYPPLPYPPATTTTDSTATNPIPFGPYISHASRQPMGPPRTQAGETAFGLSTIESERTSMAASVSSLSTRGEGDGDQENSYRGEEEAVGRLELDDSPALSQEAHHEEMRGRPAWSALPPQDAEADDEDIGVLAAAAIRHSRDPTPAARQHATGYFAGSSRRSRSRGGAISPPDMPWMA